MFTRRDFLKTSTLLALAPTIPGFLAQTARASKADRDGRILVVVQSPRLPLHRNRFSSMPLPAPRGET
jgi:hypothetical protein